jgi:plastocyanin
LNTGRELHEVDAPEFFKTVTPADPAMLVREGQEIDVEPDSQADFLFVPNAAGQFPFECEDHAEFGMKGSIAVK